MRLSDTDEKYERNGGGWSKIPLILLILSVVLLIGVCLLEPKGDQETSVESSSSTVQQLLENGKPGTYDSADTAVLLAIDQEEKTLTFLNLEVEKKYTLTMDGATKLYDKYGDTLSLSQIRPGDVVDITFLKDTKHLAGMQLSAESWTYSNVENYELDVAKNQISIGSENLLRFTEPTSFCHSFILVS